MQLYNTLSRKKEEFKPIQGKKVRLYTCGLTVYNYAHIGNLRTYLFEDVLKRTLIYNGYKIKHIENITDVGHLVSDADEGEDKMMKALKREGLKVSEKSLLKLADKYTKAFKQDKKLLNLLSPDKYVKATDHVKEMIKMIQKIENNGYAYQTKEAVYFDTAKLKDYGQLAQLTQNESELKSRIDQDPEKKNPRDFALWFKAVGKNKNHIMQWGSPWGKGFPGWHIECSAMSIKYLGCPFDIHCGGVDHIPVHHTNEIAQNQAAEDKPTVNFWLHGEFLTIDQGRMGKSQGNFITLKTLLDKGFDPLAYRYLTLQTHYRQKLNFSWDAVLAAQNALFNLSDVVASYDKPKIGCAEYEQRFLQAINDDLNTPQALAVVWDLIKDDKLPTGAKKHSLLKFDQVLGLGLIKAKTAKAPAAVKKLADQREVARQIKDWQKADELRRLIDQSGWLVEDSPSGPIIKLKRK